MPRQLKKLTLGKGAAFVKSRLMRLPLEEDETWEADFRALPKPLSENETHYLGLVVVEGEGSVLAEEPVEHTPDINDLATLLAHAMRRPLTGSGHRPKRIRVRKNPRWPELFPHLQEIGIEVVVNSDLDTHRLRRPPAPGPGVGSWKAPSTTSSATGEDWWAGRWLPPSSSTRALPCSSRLRPTSQP
jgi:hypothetical protein